MHESDLEEEPVLTLAERLNKAMVWPHFDKGETTLRYYPAGNMPPASWDEEYTAYVDTYEGERVVCVEVGDEKAVYSLERGEPEWGDIE